MNKKFYLTTPIYYPSDNLHIGHTYTTIVADTIKKYKELQGYDVFFVTGSDEHGQKIQEKANEENMSPKDYVDGIVENFKKLWEMLEINYDEFVRSTDPQHQQNVKDIFKKLYDKGEIYKSVYKGAYCTPCESFWSDSQLLEDGNCPDCGRATHIQEEEAYFFRLSKYRDKLLKLYEDKPGFIQPESRKNEMVNNFLKDGLEDLSVSRSSFDWGVEVEFDKDHVVYVWIDALSCYLTGVGYGRDEEKFNHYWPADLHIVGKEIVRFHTIIWPAILMALELPLPDKVFGHGWILFDDDKMSKSKGNVIYAEPIVELYGIDAYKYFLLREFTFGQDGSFTKEKFLQRLNSDLANDLGNLVSRTITMIEKYNDGIISEDTLVEDVDISLKDMAESLADKIEEDMDNLNISLALENIWKLIRRTNKYVDETMPWVLAKEENKQRLDSVLFNLSESLRIISILVKPFMEKTSHEIRNQLGIKAEARWENAKTWKAENIVGSKVVKGKIIFPRLEIDKEIEKLNIANEELIQSRKKEKQMVDENSKAEITIDEFDKMDLKVGKIIKCEDHPNADKLLVFEVKIGEETRTIVSGIKKWYDKDDLIGKKVIVITNLKPVKLRGVESRGMILAAEDKNNNLTLLSTLEDIEDGSSIS